MCRTVINVLFLVCCLIGTQIVTAAVSNGFDFPLCTPTTTEKLDDYDGCYVSRNFGEDGGHAAEDWNGDIGGNNDEGYPVYATSNGIVVSAKSEGPKWGNVMLIEHELPSGNKVRSLYGHLKNMDKSAGQGVFRGEKIGEVGRGYFYGIDENGDPRYDYTAHLHFEIRNDVSIGVVNPYRSDRSGWEDPTNFILQNRFYGVLARDDQTTAQSGSPIVIDVLANDSNGSGNTSLHNFTQGNNGSVSLSQIGIVYTPNAGFVGTDSFSYTISDISGATSTATVTITVVPATFSIGDNVKVDAAASPHVNVRRSPSGNKVGTQLPGSQGVIRDGTEWVPPYWWWKVDFLNSDVDGWVAEPFIVIDDSIVIPPVILDSAISGVVKDAVSQAPLDAVQVRLTDNGVLSEVVSTDLSGTYLFENLEAKLGYSVSLEKFGYLTENYEGIETQVNATRFLATVLQIDEQYSGIGNISGTISSALDGNGISGLVINFRKGINVRSGNIVKDAITEINGFYGLSGLEAGNYTGEILGSGYQTNYFTVVVLGGITNDNQDGTINPILVAGETRIVLTWGSTPADLDSHLTGPVPNSADRFRVYFGSKGSIDSSPFSNLDIDDVSSFGPETVTIRQQFVGVYRYSVHDFSNQSSTTSNLLANSSAQVKVYQGQGLVAEYNIPNQAGTLWTVFEISGNQIIPINSVTYEQP